MSLTTPTPPEQSSLGVRPGGFRQWFIDLIGTFSAWRAVLIPTSAGSVYRPADALLTLSNGFTHFVDAGSGWNGLWVQRVGHLVIITGTVTRASAWTAGTIIASLPVGLRPAHREAGSNCEALANGSLIINPAGSSATILKIVYAVAP